MTLLLALVLMVPPSSRPPPSSTPSPLSVQFELPRYIEAPGAPVMQVTVTNETDAPLQISAFERAVCFAWFQLEMEVKRHGGPALIAAPCDLKAFSGTTITLEPRGQLKKALPFSELFPTEKWAGVYDIRVDWEPTQLRTVAPNQPSPRAKETSLSVLQFAVLTAVSRFEVKKGGVASLAGGGQFAFTSHSHKRTYPGQESPLIIHGKISDGSGELRPFSKQVFLRESRFFSVEPKLLFRLDDHVYDQSMKLTYFGASAIEE